MNTVLYYIQLYCTTISVQPAPSRCATSPSKKRGRYHSYPRKDDKKCEHKCTKCGKHTVKTLAYSCLSCPLPSLLMQNDIVQHLSKVILCTFIHSFIHFEHFYSAPSRRLLRSAPD